MVGITAWFPDGTSYDIPWPFLCRFNEQVQPQEWISEEETRDLAANLFGVDAELIWEARTVQEGSTPGGTEWK